MKLASAGNIEPVIFQLLKQNGYDVTIVNKNWIAKKGNDEVIGNNVIELLGLIKLIEMKGEYWKIEDHLIDEFLNFIKNNE